MFSKKGVIVVAKSAADEDKLTEIVLDAGADDLTDEGDNWEILTSPKDYEAVMAALTAAKIKPEHAEVTMISSTYTKLEGAQATADDAPAGRHRRSGRHAELSTPTSTWMKSPFRPKR